MPGALCGARTTPFTKGGGYGGIRALVDDVIEAHRGMNTGTDRYLAAIDDIMETLAQHGIDEPTRKDVLMISYAPKDEIIRQ